MSMMVSALALMIAAAPLKDTAIVLPVSVPAEMESKEQSLQALLARGALLKAFEERGISVLTSGMTLVTKEETGLNFADPEIWDTERYQLIANRWGARYVASLKVTSVVAEERQIDTKGGPPAPGMQLVTTVKSIANLWDNKSKKYITENKEFEESFTVGRPGPSEQQIVDEKRSAIGKQASKVFAEYLGKLPKVKIPPAKPGKGGGG
jgi:hypothetical protein